MSKKIYRKILSAILKIKLKNKNKINVFGKINLNNRNVIIGNNVILYPNVTFYGDGIIKIGDNVKIGDNCILHASKKGGIEIGNNTIIAANSYIIDMNHGTQKSTLIQKNLDIIEKVSIGEDCWIGQDVTILKGVNLGNGCVVGAKSLLNKSFADYKIVAGVPANVIKERM